MTCMHARARCPLSKVTFDKIRYILFNHKKKIANNATNNNRCHNSSAAFIHITFIVLSPLFVFVLRLHRPSDAQLRGEKRAVGALPRVEAAGLYRGHRRHLLGVPDGVQRVALPPPKEEERPQQQLHRHPQGCVALNQSSRVMAVRQPEKGKG